MLTETIDLDAEIAQAEQRARALRDARERRRGELQIRLRALQNQLSAATTAPPPANPNADPGVLQLHAAFVRAQDALREHQKRRPHCNVPPQYWLTPSVDYRGEIERQGAVSRAFEEREAALMDAVRRAAAAYSRGVGAKADELAAASSAAQQQREIAAAGFKVQIATIEAEILKLRG